MMKYVRHATKGFYLFTMIDEVMHLDVAYSVGRDEIISAGFVGVVDGELKCFGESLSLGIKSLEEDTELLHEQLGVKPKVTAMPNDVCGVCYHQKEDSASCNREDCPNSISPETACEYFSCQRDGNGEIAINYCSHPENPIDTEGNCTTNNCPLTLGDGE